MHASARPALFLLSLLATTGCGSPTTSPSARIFPPADRGDGTLPELTATSVSDSAMRLDGKLDEPAWQTAGRTGTLVHPTTGRDEPGSEVRGEARFLYSDTTLYVAFEVADTSPETPFDRGARDPHVWEQSSGIELMLQPGDHADNRDYFELQTDVAGALWATRFDDYNSPVGHGPDGQMHFGHEDWSPSVRSAATHGSTGYVIEFAVPFADLRTERDSGSPHAGDVWRVNVYTFRNGQSDSLAWSPILGQGNFHFAARWGKVRFGNGP